MKRKGFTLIEVLVTAIISSIILMGIVSVIVVSNKVVNRSVLESQMQSSGLSLLETIGDDVKRGIVLASADSLEMTIRDSVGVFATYKFSDGKLLKNEKEMNVFADSYEMSGNFAVNTLNRYYSVNITLDLAIRYKEGEIFRTNTINNTYYCRLDPEGYGL